MDTNSYDNIADLYDTYVPATFDIPYYNHIVDALQFFEEYDPQGALISKRLLELHFRLSSNDEFEELVNNAGFKIKTLYGDYSYAEFYEATSPYMIWLLEQAG